MFRAVRAASPALLLALAVLSPSRADALEWHRLAQPRSRAGSPEVAAEAALRDAALPLRIEGLRLVRAGSSSLAGGAFRTVRFSQEHAGLPVLGSGAAVRVGPAGRVPLVTLAIARGLSVSPEPSIDAATARAVVAGQRGSASVDGPEPHLAIQAEEGPGRLVWVVDVFTPSGGERHLVDAHRGTPAGFRSLGRDVKGRVYAISQTQTPEPVDVELEDLVKPAEGSPQRLDGWAGNFSVANYVSGSAQNGKYQAEQTLAPTNEAGDFLHDPPADPSDPNDGFAQVNLYHHITRMRGYYEASFGLDMSPASWSLLAIANLRENGAPLDNAFFSQMGIGAPWNRQNLIGIGQGSAVDFAVDSDVFLHEFTHYVTHNAVGYNEGQLATTLYGLSPWGGSIDEGVSDYFACTLNDDPVLGEASLGVFGVARDLEDTAKRCPEDISGEVHADGEIIGSLGWSLRKTFGQEKADALVWGSVALLQPGSTLGDFGRGVTATAESLVSAGKMTQAEADAIPALLEERGLDECDEELPIGPDKTYSTQMVGLGLVGQLFGASCQQVKSFGISLPSLFHYEAKTAPTDGGIRFSVGLQPFGGGSLDWGIYVRKNTHVTFTAPQGFPQVLKFDHKVDGFTGESGEIVIDASSDPPFEPGASYHMVIVHQNCPVTVATVASAPASANPGTGGEGGATSTSTVTASSSSSGAAGGEGGEGGGDEPKAGPPEEDAGCGCRAAPVGGGAGWLMALGAAGAAVARRRRKA